MISIKRYDILVHAAEAWVNNWFLITLNPKSRGPTLIGKCWGDPLMKDFAVSHAIAHFDMSCTWEVGRKEEEIVKDFAGWHWDRLVNQAGLKEAIIGKHNI